LGIEGAAFLSRQLPRSISAIPGTEVLMSCWEDSVKMCYEERFDTQMKLGVVVADDNASFLEKLVSILEIEFEVVKTAIDGRSALEIIIDCQPDVVQEQIEQPGR